MLGHDEPFGAGHHEHRVFLPENFTPHQFIKSTILMQNWFNIYIACRISSMTCMILTIFRALLTEIITNFKNPHYSHTANIKVSFIDWLCINFGFIHNAVIHSVLLHMNWILWGGSSYPTRWFIVPHHWGTMNRLDLFVSNHYYIRMDISYKSETLP